MNFQKCVVKIIGHKEKRENINTFSFYNDKILPRLFMGK